MTDPIADMLTRIRNAQMVRKSEVIMPYSKLKLSILELLAKEGWIKSVEKVEPTDTKNVKLKKNDTQNGRFITLLVKLKYKNKKTPHITNLKRISKPGRRVYVSKEEIPIVLNGKGSSVISTSKGLLTDSGARKDKIGGEVICQIY
jgi:small subunit ribosomal protein S8